MGIKHQVKPRISLLDSAGMGENFLFLLRLFFAGANPQRKGADSLAAEDGILTAYEVSAMNLEGTELVVLSACEIGLGKRSFLKALYLILSCHPILMCCFSHSIINLG